MCVCVCFIIWSFKLIGLFHPHLQKKHFCQAEAETTIVKRYFVPIILTFKNIDINENIIHV